MNDYYIKRNIRILKSLNDEITSLKLKYAYKSNIDLISELLELGIEVFRKRDNLEHKENLLLDKMNKLISLLDNDNE